MRHFVPLLLILLLGTLISCEQQGAPKTGDLTNLAKGFVELMINGDHADAVQKFDQTMKDAMPVEKLQEAWQGLLTQAGPFKKQIGLRQTKEQGYDVRSRQGWDRIRPGCDATFCCYAYRCIRLAQRVYNLGRGYYCCSCGRGPGDAP